MSRLSVPGSGRHFLITSAEGQEGRPRNEGMGEETHQDQEASAGSPWGGVRVGQAGAGRGPRPQPQPRGAGDRVSDTRWGRRGSGCPPKSSWEEPSRTPLRHMGFVAGVRTGTRRCPAAGCPRVSASLLVVHPRRCPAPLLCCRPLRA